MSGNSGSPYTIIPCRDGSHTIHDDRVGHGMHSHVGPGEESRVVYIEASKLRDRLDPVKDPAPLVIWDVGMGIAANALAALECRESLVRDTGSSRDLRIVSFENDLRGIRLALDALEKFPMLHPHAEMLGELVKTREVTREGLIWTLLEGDFFETARQAPAPELVYWDFYSPPSCPALWSIESFQAVMEAAKPRLESGLPTHLFTYSAATPVRAAMLLAGLHVGYGRRTSMKNETTEACTLPGCLERPLGREWLEKFDRSTRREPWPSPKCRDPEESRLRELLLARINRI